MTFMSSTTHDIKYITLVNGTYICQLLYKNIIAFILNLLNKNIIVLKMYIQFYGKIPIYTYSVYNIMKPSVKDVFKQSIEMPASTFATFSGSNTTFKVYCLLVFPRTDFNNFDRTIDRPQNVRYVTCHILTFGEFLSRHAIYQNFIHTIHIMSVILLFECMSLFRRIIDRLSVKLSTML